MRLDIFDLGPAALGFCLIAVFLAAIVRGYSGFGFSALMIASLTLVVPPAEAVPIILLLEVAASIGMLPQVWRDVHWRAIAWLTLGAVVGAPLGVHFLATVSADAVRVIIALLVLSASFLLLRGYRPGGERGPASTLATGFVSGLVNGVGAVGGLPVVLFLLASAAGAAMTRAVVVAYFFITDIYASGLLLGQGLLTQPVLARTTLFLVPLAVGVLIGSRRFLRSEPEAFRRFTLWLLIALAILGLVRAALL